MLALPDVNTAVLDPSGVNDSVVAAADALPSAVATSAKAANEPNTSCPFSGVVSATDGTSSDVTPPLNSSNCSSEPSSSTPAALPFAGHRLGTAGGEAVPASVPNHSFAAQTPAV